MTEQKPLSAEEALRKFDSMLYRGRHGEFTIVDLQAAWWDDIRPALAARAATPAAPEALRERVHAALGGYCIHTNGAQTDSLDWTLCGQVSAALAASPAPARHSGDLAALKARGWLKHTDGCSWEFRKEDGSKECDCGLIDALRGAATPAAPEALRDDLARALGLHYTENPIPEMPPYHYAAVVVVMDVLRKHGIVR